MRVLHPTTVVCPRCGATVSTEYKYCPECAFRLRAGLDDESEAQPASSLWPHVLLLLGALALVGGFVLAGISIFGGPDVARDLHPEVGHQTVPVITIKDLADELAVIEEGVADWQPDLDASGRPVVNEFGELVQLPVITADMYVSKYEISAGQWAEFLVDLDRRAAQEPDPLTAFDPALVRHLFTPFAPQRDATGALVDPLDTPGDWNRSIESTLAAMNDELDAAVWAQGYADIWWRAVTDHFRARGEQRPDRPTSLALPLGPAQRRLMLAPPHWIRTGERGSLEWSRPEHPNRPVTEIAFTDTLIFAAWVSQRLGITFHVPTKSEFMRAYHGGSIWDPATETGNRWPWGSLEQPFWVNHLGYWRDDEPALLDIDFDMRPRPGRSMALTADGLAHMAGNAREWTQSQELIRREYADPPTDDESVRFWYWARNRIRFRAPVMGGSYLSGLGECDFDAVRYDDIRERAVDIGFRLAAAKHL